MTRARGLDPIIKEFGQWAVTEYGIECTEAEHTYAIDARTVHEDDWYGHMCEKEWVVDFEFARALNYAQEVFDSEGQLMEEGRRATEEETP